MDKKLIEECSKAKECLRKKSSFSEGDIARLSGYEIISLANKLKKR